ncbi:TackOD1 domain-containing metal-binding protein [Paracoccus sediminilitoris]|uniref:TackOD1 domain-containing metal-binding protein n=1 Tax=Paracoccus sediminilitoris TaxID=2202419 RepID=UPI000DBA265C|nr:response regulator [Paracoccus sediminilitoris]
MIDVEKDVKQILLVEDSSVTKDLVELVLTQSGHKVTSVATGVEALSVLRKQHFDVIVTDFHLPDISGIEIAQRYLDANPSASRPLLIAITADTRGLLSDPKNCEIFDKVLPKPLDIDMISQIVLEKPRLREDATLTDPAVRDDFLGTLNLSVLEWPADRRVMSPSIMTGTDAIVLRKAVDLDVLWRLDGAHLLPVIDMTGGLGETADLDCARPTDNHLPRIQHLVAQFDQRREDIHPDLRRSPDPEDRLLVRMALAGRLKPRLSAEHEGFVSWNTLCEPRQVAELIEKLEAAGFVETRFFERLHVCPGCSSARMVVREECPCCGSSNLAEESYVHHFRCATQAPETDFKQGGDLICPKCRRELHHFGRDYDRPGLLTRCQGCGHTAAEPAVAFICTSCGRRSAAETAPTKDIREATISENGWQYLRSGKAYLGPGRRALRFGDFPLELVVALNRAAARFNAAQEPFTLGSITYLGLEDVSQLHGAVRARAARKLWLETLQQQMGDAIIVVAGTQHDYLLASGTRSDALNAQLKNARGQADNMVRDSIGATFALFDPEDLVA